MFSKYKKKIILSVIFGALIFLALSFYADFDKLIIAFGKFNWLWFPVILSLSFLNYIFRFFKWHYFTKVININIPVKASLLIFLSAFVMSVTPGKLGEILKSYLLKEDYQIPISKSAPIVLAERLTDFISILILCFFGAFMFDYAKGLLISIFLFFIICIILLSWRNFCVTLINNLSKLKFIAKHSRKIIDAYDSIYFMLKPKPLIISIIISGVSWFFECLGFYIVLNIFASISNVDISLLNATFIYCFSTLIGAIVMLPGGVGATEASLTGLLVVLKVPKDISAASTIIIRIATLWFAVLVGMIALSLYQMKNQRKNSEIK